MTALQIEIPVFFSLLAGTFSGSAPGSHQRALMYNGAREMNNIHADAGYCRGSGWEKSGKFFGIFSGCKSAAGKGGRPSPSGGAAGGCGDRQVADAREMFFGDYTLIDIQFRGGDGNRGIDFASGEGCGVASSLARRAGAAGQALA